MKVEEIEHWALAPPWWRLRDRVLGGLTHEEFRAMLRETYPAQLPPPSAGWWERYGHEVRRIVVPSTPEQRALAIQMAGRALRIEGHASRVESVDEEPRS